MGKIIAGTIVAVALMAGFAMYYLQVYAYYDDVLPSGPDDVMLTSLETGMAEPLAHGAFQAIDSTSSPIRYRACFMTDVPLDTLKETYTTFAHPEPLVAPGWFNCFDAKAIGKALEDGEAVAFMGTENLKYGIDRVVAVFPDGRGYAWHQINACGEVVFDGKPVPEGCPPKPER
ncbi:DUF6446 family protein [Shimia sp. SDUM112013]|uniref:DUF6446 family protein n=1 Tax=Shimia sp. SDUM112013 TaxID=3136160 RepID=UPI0032EF6EBF